ncbi:MAG: alpha/beta hydrolase [Alphaproteobacteria bacterium]|nr:alpha/beta hydrolase [Alphaproteobacteria bacterium]
MTDSDEPARLARADASTIAYRRLAGKGPGVIFLGGFRSDMEGTKALALEAACRARGRAFLRFDYSGHGRSGGNFIEGTIGQWLDDALAVIDRLTEGPQILVGSSMGGWIALLAARARPARLAGLIGIAAAPDFTERLMWDCYPEERRRALLRDGIWFEPSQYSEEPYPITLKLIEEGRRHLLLDGPLPLAVPVRLLQGMRDPDVPWTHALDLMRAIVAEDARLTLLGSGDHRLSGPAELALLSTTLDELAGIAAAV